jgi:hypothetical protein
MQKTKPLIQQGFFRDSEAACKTQRESQLAAFEDEQKSRLILPSDPA